MCSLASARSSALGSPVPWPCSGGRAAARALESRRPDRIGRYPLSRWTVAGVSRPLVYRAFPTRHALVRAILEDFTSAIGRRFHRALLHALPKGGIDAIAMAFIEASCDVIEEKGAGPWLLLDAPASDPELARIGWETFTTLLGPWQHQLAGFTGTNAKRAANDLRIIVAAGRAALFGWIDGSIPRADAVADATRAVTALLAAFQSRPRSATKKRRPAGAK